MRRAIIPLGMLLAAGVAGAATYVVDTGGDGMLTACTSAASDCTLRGAIENANLTSVVDQISFYRGVTSIILSVAGADEDANQTGDLDILEPVIISGSGIVTIDGSAVGDRVLDILTGTDVFAGLFGLTITGGQAPIGDSSFKGGGIRCVDGALSLDHVLVSDNGPVREGGGIYAESCDLIFNYTTVSNNQATLLGGGVSLFGSSTLSAPLSAIVGNDSGAFGGGLAIGTNFPLADLDNLTFSGNTAATAGSAIYNSNDVVLDFVTIVSDPGSGISAIAQTNVASASIAISNTVLVGSCEITVGPVPVSGGGNVESPGNSCSLSSTVDQTGVADPGLLPLGLYGGPTPVHMPEAHSPAVDDPLGVIGSCPTYDQRSVARPLDGDGNGQAACDSGAVERDLIFADGFESGDTSAWSAAAGG